MKILRMVLGLGVAGVGFVVALLILLVLLLFFPTDDGLVERLGWVLILALVEGSILVGTSFVFRKIWRPRPRDEAA